MQNKSWALPIKQVPVVEKLDRSIVWNNVRLCYEQKLFGQISCIRYNNAGTVVGCASTNQLSLLRVPQTEGVITNEQRERKCFSLRFRDDDKMTIMSVDQRVVIRSTETLFERQFPGHVREVRDALFLDRRSFVSGSDDTTIKLWDVMGECELAVGKAHTDYVRCLENRSPGCFFSGSYDHVINLWDTRAGFSCPTQTSGQAVPNPVESLLCLDTNLLVCGASDQIILFDIRKGLSLPLTQDSYHTKTVVALGYSKKYNVLLSGSLDQRVKIFSLERGCPDPVASKKFDAPVTAVAVHPRSSEFAVGTASGDLRIMKLGSASDGDEMGGGKDEESRGRPKDEGLIAMKVNDVRRQLVSYQYNRALKTALYSRHADVVVSTLEELLRRGALHVALSGQNDRTIARILRFALGFIDTPQFSESMMVVLDTIFDIYGTCVGKSIFLHRELMKAHRRLGSVLANLQRMAGTLSIMELIVNDV
ncbi:hypothetical protein, conserved [Trypanosoma brucei gambiense DAL972]|uniref:U3 small nucleolar RNA-associated protein 15 C-terminal domain-containing protein n=1 Tax=Trypanosoma brucei gambiense (strain MHOM/CI/86/DAL972) TaxID=679716 RepID=C9ZUX6_TRYB9|nr:hypothetical protein, conserved [Trypanosoma brucei gambiense DAL972]CBH13214.1 hypothetical protein, conserved [Trypanosoma brucei gambiense DAL972]|eukprot:XP_011775491.1 hypothetical protein, conserved [Trypanosoma brucei gambiense DAL972]